MSDQNREIQEFEESLEKTRNDLEAQQLILEKAQNDLDTLEKKINEAVPVGITEIVERLELIEEKLGVRFDGIYATQAKRSWENPIDFLVEVNFDVVGTEDTLKRSFRPTLSAYNAAGQLLNTNTSFIGNNNFLGIESIKIQLLCAEAPVRLRLYPAQPF
jgi:hypothetical protein